MGLTINPTKTTVVPFARRRTLETIQISEEAEEVFGTGTFRKATKALMVCRSLEGKTWCCNLSILR